MRARSLFRRGVLSGGVVKIPPTWADTFLTDRLAGAVNGTACEPGPGNRAVTDTQNKISISGAKLVFSGGKAAPAFGDPAYWADGQARAQGHAVILRMLWSNVTALNRGQYGWDIRNTPDAGGAGGSSWFRAIGAVDGDLDIGTIAGPLAAGVTLAINTAYNLGVILRSVGEFFLIKGGAFTDWTLLHVGLDGTDGTLYPCLTNRMAVFSVDDMQTYDLPAPWTDFGIATQRRAGAQAAGATFTHEANCNLTWTLITRPTAGAVTFDFRKQDANNYWQVSIDNTGAIVLYEFIAGVPNNRGAGAGAANGNRIAIRAVGSTIRVVVNQALKITYATAANFQTETSGGLSSLGTGGAVSDIVSWPYTLTGGALTALNRVNFL